MKYLSTRGDKETVTAAQAIVRGPAGDGGLYVPSAFPMLTIEEITALKDKTYAQRAAVVLGMFLEEFSAAELTSYTQNAYSFTDGAGPGNKNTAAPLYTLDSNTQFLELWHGPTAAFKDMALQVMPYLLTAGLKKTRESREVCILAATSGDTGKAALEGFRDVPGTSIMVFYPENGVSDIQKLQMTTQAGDNVNIVAVRGNFDDTQTGVKKIFSDKDLAKNIDESGFFLSSANSINWGRLVPQIAYYISAYCDLLRDKKIRPGDHINFCVPTGNFGNILAGYYAYKIGLPIGKLICASNRNDVLTQFINTGTYNKNRTFYKTMSPSMDILVSSNLERLLFELSDKDGSIIAGYMTQLSEKGRYEVPPQVLGQMRGIFASGYASEEDTLNTIKKAWTEHRYLIDTHTAVAYKALEDYRRQSGDSTMTVVISTASPFKFSGSVLEALGQKFDGKDIDSVNALSGCTGIPAPAPLSGLGERDIRFNSVIGKEYMLSAVTDFIGQRAAKSERGF